MVPYQIYQALSQQRGHELKATARRHELTSAAEFATASPSQSWSHRRAAELATTSPSESWSQLKSVAAHLAALVRPASRTANSGPASSGPASSAPRTKSKATSTSTAGPMGCIA